jgi:hypothetical protein
VKCVISFYVFDAVPASPGTLVLDQKQPTVNPESVCRPIVSGLNARRAKRAQTVVIFDKSRTGGLEVISNLLKYME